MNFIDLNNKLINCPQEIIDQLVARQNLVNDSDDDQKIDLINSGNPTWTLIRNFLEGLSNRKCWYTETKNPGCINDVDHFRPKGKVTEEDGVVRHWYWFLTFVPSNYRLSCQFSNRPNRNSLLRATGGKHNHFPLLPGSIYATNSGEIDAELPVLLDPCNEDDCHLLQFQPDGRPVVHINHRGNEEIVQRVDKSNLLLNLDYPTFNEDREKLYNRVSKLVERGDRYEDEGNDALSDVQDDLRQLKEPSSEYSKAAECYIRFFRDREWVEEIL